MRFEREDEERYARLARLRPGSRVLSVYIPIEKGMALHHGHVAATMDLFKDLRGGIDKDALDAFERETARVLEYLRTGYVPSGQTLAVFSSAPRRLFEVMNLQLPVRGQARFKARPYLVPVEAALEDNPRTAVALVTDERARILTLVLGEVSGELEVKDSVPGRQRQGGWSAFRYQRDRERHIKTHLVNVVDELVDLSRSRGFERLVLGGTKEATEAVERMLPKGLKSKYAGSFRAEYFRTDDEVVKAALPVAEAAEREEEKRLAVQARDRALKGMHASLGWPETLQCLKEGRVDRLLISSEQCGTPQGDEAFELSWDSGAAVEVVHGEAAEVLATNGGVASILRY